MANVVTHSRFQINELDAETLKGMGVEVLTDFPSDADLDLSDPEYGEEIVATLTTEEFSIFVEMAAISDEIATIRNSIISRKLREVADKVLANNDLAETAMDAAKKATEELFETEEDEARFFQLTAKMNLLKSTFYWVLGERYQCHAFRCGVRTRRRFVKIGKRAVNG